MVKRLRDSQRQRRFRKALEAVNRGMAGPSSGWLEADAAGLLVSR